MADTYKTVLRKKETTYGTDAAPVVATNAALTRNFSAKPLAVDALERNLDNGTRGRTRSLNVNHHTRFGYELELAGSGAAGTAPPWMEDLQACGMDAPVLTASTKAEQKFAALGSALSSLTCKHYAGNQLAVALGARGTFGLDFTAGAYPFASFDMMGLIPATPVSDATPGTPVFTQWKDPVEVNTANTSFTLDGFAAILRSFKASANANVKLRNLVGSRYVQRGDHAMTGTILIEAPSIAAKNYFATLQSSAQIVTQLIHGTVAGNIVQLDAANVQILDIERQEEDDILMLSLSVGFNIAAGSDDFMITAK